VYTQNLIQQGTALDPGADPRGALRESMPPKTAADQKIETPAWVIKPAFDRPGDARQIKSWFYRPVSYSVPCCLLITCLMSKRTAPSKDRSADPIATPSGSARLDHE